MAAVDRVRYRTKTKGNSRTLVGLVAYKGGANCDNSLTDSNAVVKDDSKAPISVVIPQDCK